MKFPVFDLHCDTALALLGKDMQQRGSLRKNTYHIDLERASALPGYAQCFACFTFPTEHLPSGMTVQDWFHKELSVLQDQVCAHSDLIGQAKTAADVERNFGDGKMSAIFTIEGPAGFGFDPSRLEKLYEIGFRMTTLTWNEKNVLAGSHRTGGGLTDIGREYVAEAQRLGMIVDVSHISDEAFWDIMDITQAPVIASHSNSRKVCGVSRNLTDEMFLEICRTGGTAGLNQYVEFLGDNADLNTACDHILHFLELDPDGKHISLGGDLDGCDELPKEFTGIQDYPRLAQKLLERGLDEKLVRNIFWDNALGVMKKCCM